MALGQAQAILIVRKRIVKGYVDFIDTNVFFYEWDDRDPRKQSVAIDLLAGDPRRMAASVQVYCELSVNLGKKLGFPPAKITGILGTYDLIRCNRSEKSTVVTAIDIADRYQLSFWDGLIIAAAKEAKCTRILTEDLSHGQVIEGIEIVNPFIPNSIKFS